MLKLKNYISFNLLTKFDKQFKNMNKKHFTTIKSNSKTKDLNSQSSNTSSNGKFTNTNPTNAKREETIFLFSHESAKTYYKINVLPLVGYLVVAISCINNKEYPDYLRRTMYLFSAASATILTGIAIYAKRHISSIHLTKPSNILQIKTFSKLGFGKEKSYQIPLKEIGDMVPISKYIKTKKTGIYMLKPAKNVKYFNFFNFFFIRPKSSLEFDQIFKSKIKKHN